MNRMSIACFAATSPDNINNVDLQVNLLIIIILSEWPSSEK